MTKRRPIRMLFSPLDDRQTMRSRMIEDQLIARHIADPRVLDAMQRVPRHLFVPKEQQTDAYADRALPIGLEQTISQPLVIAYMLQLMALTGSETVLEIGTGSGYQTALLSHLAQDVYSIERHQPLADAATIRLKNLGLSNVHLFVGDGSVGLPDSAPFDAITIGAATPALPTQIMTQLRDQGRLIVPIGDRGGQYIERVIRQGATWTIEQLMPVSFVPLIGQGGFAVTTREIRRETTDQP